MTKIVSVLNAMISHPDNISKVIRYGDEIFFMYKKYKWSLSINENGKRYVRLYPNDLPLEKIAQMEPYEWQEGDIPIVGYSMDDIGTRESEITFSELYRILKERVYGINQIFDDILLDDI